MNLNVFATQDTDIEYIKVIQPIFEPYVNEHGLYNHRIPFIHFKNCTPEFILMVISNINCVKLSIYDNGQYITDMNLILESVERYTLNKYNFITDIKDYSISIIYRTSLIKVFELGFCSKSVKKGENYVKFRLAMGNTTAYITNALNYNVCDTEKNLLRKEEYKSIKDGINRLIW